MTLLGAHIASCPPNNVDSVNLPTGPLQRVSGRVKSNSLPGELQGYLELLVLLAAGIFGDITFACILDSLCCPQCH